MSEQNQAQEVVANFDNKVEKKDVKFSFRKVTTKDEATGLESETKRPTLELSLPLISIEGIIAAFQAGGKQLDLILEALQDVQISRARELVNENENITTENFPYEALNWETIANLPKAERRGGGISKELWEEFAKDYIIVMPAVSGKTEDQVKNAAKILLNKFQQVKTAKPILKLLKEQLALYLQHSPNAETYSECVDFLVDKADKFLNISEADLLSSL